jgi:hypothetical protein
MDRILTAGGSRIQRKKGKVKCVQIQYYLYGSFGGYGAPASAEPTSRSVEILPSVNGEVANRGSSCLFGCRGAR